VIAGRMYANLYRSKAADAIIAGEALPSPVSSAEELAWPIR